MQAAKTLPYGEWISPITAARVAAGSRTLAQPRWSGTAAYWLESRAAEGGRMTLMRAAADGGSGECTAAPFNVRTRVHEYGGAAYLAFGDSVVFSHYADNRLHLLRGTEPARTLTADDRHRFADCILDAGRRRLIAVREDHGASDLQPQNTLCAVDLEGAAGEMPLAQGRDFYAAPRLAPDGKQLAWLCWDHPNMPWECAELWLAGVMADGTLAAPRRIAGGGSEAICQPEWSPDGRLHFVSDRSGWGNLYRLAGAAVEAVYPLAAEFGRPHWLFGEASYGFTPGGELICTFIEEGISRLARINPADGTLQRIETGYTDIQELRVGAGEVLLVAGAPRKPLELARLRLSDGCAAILARSVDEVPDPGYLSEPQAIHFASANGSRSHAFYYPPHNKDYQAPPAALPPLIVIIHGGPTSRATSTLKLATQYWTSRGFAVLDVNYRGSSGFGRAYQDALKGQWGVADVEDCVFGARHLVERGQADPARLIIRGSSAGGFTTLCALAFHDAFRAGACLYGVSDLKALDQDSHKFESHYNHYLTAPPPECERLYRERSPIHHVERLRRPMIFFQGLDDKVVPPAQSQAIAAALAARGVPVAYLEFAGEGHGFRQAQTIRRVLEAELAFYARVFKFAIGEPIEALTINNL